MKTRTLQCFIKKISLGGEANIIKLEREVSIGYNGCLLYTSDAADE